jgi:protein-L-isoaspartate(D-aspartate) O-methyltransferase
VPLLVVGRPDRRWDVVPADGWREHLFIGSLAVLPQAHVARRRGNLIAEDIHNVQVVEGDGTEGCRHAPHDAAVVSAAFPRVPHPLVDQLRTGGRLVQPIGPGGEDQVILFERTKEGLVERERLLPARFVRLYGRRGYQ